MESVTQENAALPQAQLTSIEQPKQNNFLVVLLAVLLSLSVSIAGFFAYQTQTLVKELTLLKSSPTPVSSTEPTFDPTADWKIYTNNDFGFSFYYPKDYKLVTDGWEKIGDNPKGHYVVNVGDPSDEFNINIDIRKSSSRSGGNYKEITVADTTAYEDLDSVGKYVFFEKDGYSYDMQVLSLDSNKTNTEENLVFDQILSTFKFTDSNSNVPKSISTLFDSINTKFNLNLVPTEESQFYSPSGPITKKSWKIDLMDANLGKQLPIFLNSQLILNSTESAGIGGGGVDAYENSDIKCFHSFMSQGPDIHNYLTCAEK